jgi:hypothetical protein
MVQSHIQYEEILFVCVNLKNILFILCQTNADFFFLLCKPTTCVFILFPLLRLLFPQPYCTIVDNRQVFHSHRTVRKDFYVQSMYIFFELHLHGSFLFCADF